jgi:hypothetical protein
MTGLNVYRGLEVEEELVRCSWYRRLLPYLPEKEREGGRQEGGVREGKREREREILG